MQQQETERPGATVATSDEATKEERIYWAGNLVAKLARAKPIGDPTEYHADRHEASKELAKLGIGRNHFGTLVTSFNHSGASGIRGFLEHHFLTWNGEEAQIQS